MYATASARSSVTGVSAAWAAAGPAGPTRSPPPTRPSPGSSVTPPPPARHVGRRDRCGGLEERPASPPRRRPTRRSPWPRRSAPPPSTPPSRTACRRWGSTTRWRPPATATCPTRCWPRSAGSSAGQTGRRRLPAHGQRRPPGRRHLGVSNTCAGCAPGRHRRPARPLRAGWPRRHPRPARPTGWGLSLDLDLDDRAQAWMRDNGWRYGYFEDVAGEPWHWTYRA